MTVIFNSGNIQAINDFVQLSLLNDAKAQTNISVNVSEVLNGINVENIVEKNIDSGAKILNAASTVAQLGAIVSSKFTDLNNSFANRFAKLFGNNITDAYGISAENAADSMRIVTELISYTGIESMNVSDMQELYFNLEIMQQQGRNDSVGKIQSDIIYALSDSEALTETQKYKILSNMASMTINNMSNNISSADSNLIQTIGLALSVIEVDNLSDLSDIERNKVSTSFNNIINLISSTDINQQDLLELKGKLNEIDNLISENYMQNLIRNAKVDTQARTQLQSALENVKDINFSNGSLQIVTNDGSINATVQDLIDFGYLNLENVAVNSNGTLTLTLNQNSNIENNVIENVTLNQQEIQSISLNTNSKALLERLIMESKNTVMDEIKSENESESEDLTEKRFNLLKSAWMNGYASNFLNRFSATEYEFTNNEIYKNMQETINGRYKSFEGEWLDISVSKMDIAVLGQDLEIAGRNLEYLGEYIGILYEEYSSLKGKTGDELVAAEQNATFSKQMFNASGYSSYEYLIPRLKMLQELRKSGEYAKIEADYTKAYQVVNEFISQNVKGTERTTRVMDTNSLDRFRELLDTGDMTLEQKSMALRILAQECYNMSNAKGYSLRASQNETVSTFLRGENAALGMGGGKTVSYCVDAVIHRVILGQNANIEILVGNDDPANFTKKGEDARRVLEFAGLKVADLNDFKHEGQSSDIDGLRTAYNDANTVVIVTPTTKAHMLNEAVSMGAKGQEMSAILNSVNRVLADEIHLWALTTTAAVIGGNNNPPSQQVIENALKISDTVDAKAIVEQMQQQQSEGKKKSEWILNVNVNGIQTEIRFFNTFEDVGSYTSMNSAEQGRIAVIGETSANTQIFMSQNLEQGLETANLNKGEVSSIMKGLLADSSKGGMAIWSQEIYGEQADNKVKPMGDTIQTNMVIGDINLQIGFALKTAISGGMTNNVEISKFIENSTQTSDTSMQTSLAALYSNSHAHIVGGTGTVSGLEQLIISRSGAGKVTSITGESLNVQDFSVTTQSASEVTEDVINRVTAEGSDLNNALFLAKKADNIEIIKSQIFEMIKDGRIQLTGENAYTVYVFAGTENGTMEIGEDGKMKIVPNNEQLTDVAKNKNNKYGNRIIISNDFGMTGIDYQGNFEQVSFDFHLMNNADAAQNIKRTGRPGGEKGRWSTNRIVVYNEAEFQSQINDFKSNEQLVETARQLWNGEKALGYLFNEKALEIMSALESGNWSLEQLEKQGKFTNADIIDFVTNIRTLYSVDQSVRFALNDSMRDRMLLSTLRDLEQRTSGADRELVSQALSQALAKGEASADFSYEKSKESGVDTASQVIEDSFNRIAAETEMYLNRLIPALSDASAIAMAQNQLEQIETARIYNDMETIKNKGLSDTVDVLEFMQVIKSFEEYILPMRAAANTKESADILITDAVDMNTENAEMILEEASTNTDLYTQVNDNKYLTKQGLAFVNLAQTMSNQNADVKSVLLSLLFALVSGYGVPPEEEEKQVAAIVKGLRDNGIEDMDGVISFVNIAASMNKETLQEKLSSITSLTQFKNIINVKEPVGFAQNIDSPVSARTASILKVFDENSEIANNYEELVKLYYQKAQYRLDVDKKTELTLSGLKENKLFAAVIGFADIIGKSIAFLPMSALLSVANGILNINGNSLYDTLKQVLAIDAISLVKGETSSLFNKKENEKDKDNKETGLLENALKLFEALKERVNYNKNKKNIETTIDGLNKKTNLQLISVSDWSKESIKAQMEIANVEVNAKTDRTIENVIPWLKDNNKLDGLTLKDIAALTSLSEIISLSKEQGQEKLAQELKDLSKEDIQKIVKSATPEKTAKEILNLSQESVEKEGNVIPFVANCAKKAVEAMGAEYDENKTAGDYVLDVLKVAGIATKEAVSLTQSLLGTVRANLGENFEYAILNDTSKLDNDVIAYYENEKGQGHVEKVRNRAEIEAKEIEGYKFTGIVLADKKVIKETENMSEIYSTETAKEIIKAMSMNKLSKKQIGEIEETLGAVINGVTKPEEMNLTVSAVLSICENANEMAQLIGYKDIEEVKRATIENIISKYNEKVGQVLSMNDTDKQDMQATIKILSVTRDMLIMVKKDESVIEKLDNPKTTVEDIMSKLVISKAVNQNIVTELVKESVGRNSTEEEFVIDVDKLKKAVMDKITVINAEDKLKDLGALLLQGRGAGKKSMPISLMRLSDIHAVAASA